MKYLILTILLIAIKAYSSIDIYFDYSSFRGSDGMQKFELYYSINDTAFTYEKFEGVYYGYIDAKATIKSKAKVESQSKFTITSEVQNLSGLNSSIIIGQEDFLLYSGSYELVIELTDRHKPSRIDRIVENINIPDFGNNSVLMSGIQFSKLIEKQSESQINWSQKFFKNGLYVVPNASSEFLKISSDEVNLYSYFELYNMNLFEEEGYTIEYRVFDAINKEVYFLPINKKTSNNAVVEQVEIPLTILPTGVYSFDVKVKYPQNEHSFVLHQKKKFYLFTELRPELQAAFTEDQKFELSPFASLDANQIKEEFNKLKIIATKAEIDQFNRLSETKAQKRFIYRFWNVRDTDTLTLTNEAYIDYQRRIQFCNIYFRVGKMKEGWNTERGHTVLQYGMPTERREYEQKTELNAYEEWFFQDVQGGVFFYFVDILGYGDFIKVHSTAWNEVRNENWYNEFVIQNNRYDRQNEQGNRR